MSTCQPLPAAYKTMLLPDILKTLTFTGQYNFVFINKCPDDLTSGYQRNLRGAWPIGDRIPAGTIFQTAVAPPDPNTGALCFCASYNLAATGVKVSFAVLNNCDYLDLDSPPDQSGASIGVHEATDAGNQESAAECGFLNLTNYGLPYQMANGSVHFAAVFKRNTQVIWAFYYNSKTESWPSNAFNC